jgi:hypothetical protein
MGLDRTKIIQDVYSSPITRSVLGNYNTVINGSDFAVQRTTNNGQLLVELSADPLAEDTLSYLEYLGTVTPPFNLDVPLSISQRSRGQFFELSMIQKLSNATDMFTVSPAIAMTSISQSSTTITIILATPTNIQVGEWFNTYGVDDSRLNICNAVVSSVSADKLTITCGYTGDVVNTSLTISAITSLGYFKPQDKPSSSLNGASYVFSGTSATSASLLLQASGSNVRTSGTNATSHLLTNASTTPVFVNAGNSQFEIKPTSSFELEIDKTSVGFLDYGVDSAAAQSAVRLLQETGIPEYYAGYTPLLRALTSKSTTRPVAKIVSAVKSGTTTATITTDVVHGLIANKSVVDIIGCRDQTNFITTTGITIATVPTSNTFTIVFGTAVTANTYGGSVSLRNGSNSTVGNAAQAIQSLSIDANGIMSVVGSSTWSGITVGEYVNLHGVRADLTGVDLGFDGAYVLIDLNGTTMKLKAVLNPDGTNTKNGLGINVTPAMPVTSSVNCGGSVIMRTTGRIHDLRLEERNYKAVKIWGQGESRTDIALPVTVQNTSTVAISGTPTVVSTLNPATSGATSGATMASYILAATTNSQLVITGAKNLFTIDVSNDSATKFWLKIYNKATAPTVGTDVPVLRYLVPANTMLELQIPQYYGAYFSLGIGFATTGLVADSDTTAITAGSVVTINYK